jgi:phenylacetate-CoA ligase
MGKRLLGQLQYFGNREDALPEWKHAASINSIEELWRMWPSLPILTKNDLQTRFHPQEIKERFNLSGIISSTGGSTGEPTPYFHDNRMLVAKHAASLYSQLKIGWSPGMPIIRIWGSERDIGKRMKLKGRIHLFLMNQWLIDGYELSEITTTSIVELVRRYHPVAIAGFTSMLEYVAKEIITRELSIKLGWVHTAWNGGEMLFDEQSNIFHKAFGVPILNYYGGRELSIMAFQSRQGSHLQIMRPLLFLEIINEQGNPSKPGEIGRLIWTSTICRGTPFIRYDVGDLGCYDSEDYDDSGIRSIKELHGRTGGLLKLPNGKTIGCLFWNHLFKEFSDVSQFQVALKGNKEIKLRFKGTPFSSAKENELIQILKNFLGDISVSIKWVEKIPLTKQGKLEQVVREND